MLNIESEHHRQNNVCDLQYLTETMAGKKHLIRNLMVEFLKEIPEELHAMNEAIAISDYANIRVLAHNMKSSVSVMGVMALTGVLEKMEDLGAKAIQMEEIEELNGKLNTVCQQALEEIEKEKHNYV